MVTVSLCRVMQLRQLNFSCFCIYVYIFIYFSQFQSSRCLSSICYYFYYFTFIGLAAFSNELRTLMKQIIKYVKYKKWVYKMFKLASQTARKPQSANPHISSHSPLHPNTTQSQPISSQQLHHPTSQQQSNQSFDYREQIRQLFANNNGHDNQGNQDRDVGRERHDKIKDSNQGQRFQKMVEGQNWDNGEDIGGDSADWVWNARENKYEDDEQDKAGGTHQSNFELLESKIKYYVETGVNRIREEQFRQAHVFLKQAQKLVEMSIKHNRKLDLEYILCVLQNQAHTYYKQFQLQKCSGYLSTIIENLRSSTENQEGQAKALIFSASIEQRSALKQKTLKYMLLIKYSVQQIGIYSHLGKHEDVINAVKKCMDIVVQLAQILMLLEIVGEGKDGKQIGKTVLQGLVQAKDVTAIMQQKQNTPQILTLIKTMHPQLPPPTTLSLTHPPKLLTQIQYTSVQQLQQQLSINTHEYLTQYLKTQLTLYTSLLYFLLATEYRVIAAEKYSEHRKVTDLYRQSRKLHLKSLELYSRYVGVWGKFIEVVFQSYQRNYDGVQEEGQISQIPVESQNIGRIPDKKPSSIKTKLPFTYLQNPQKTQSLQQLKQIHSKISHNPSNQLQPIPSIPSLPHSNEHQHQRQPSSKNIFQNHKLHTQMLELGFNGIDDELLRDISGEKGIDLNMGEGEEDEEKIREAKVNSYWRSNLGVNGNKKIGGIKDVEFADYLSTKPKKNTNSKQRITRKAQQSGQKSQKTSKSTKQRKKQKSSSNNERISKSQKFKKPTSSQKLSSRPSNNNVGLKSKPFQLNPNPIANTPQHFLKNKTNSTQKIANKFSIYGMTPISQQHIADGKAQTHHNFLGKNVEGKKSKRKTEDQSSKNSKSRKDDYSLQRKTCKSKGSKDLSNSVERFKFGGGYKLKNSDRQEPKYQKINTESQQEYLLLNKKSNKKIAELVKKYGGAMKNTAPASSAKTKSNGVSNTLQIGLEKQKKYSNISSHRNLSRSAKKKRFSLESLSGEKHGGVTVKKDRTSLNECLGISYANADKNQQSNAYGVAKKKAKKQKVK